MNNLAALTEFTGETVLDRSLFIGFALMLCVAASADDSVGSIVYAKGNEFVQPAALGLWQPAEHGRALDVGDRLRTGAFGALAVVLRDETQIRLRRNTEFVIEGVRGDGVEQTSLSVVSGALWSRANARSLDIPAALAERRKRRILQMRTTTATIGIRGTDWHVSVDPASGTTRVVMLSGAGDVFNDFGQVELNPGEEAIVESGKAPNKRVVVDFKDRPLMALESRPPWLELLRITAGAAPPADAVGSADASLLSQARAAAASADHERGLALLDSIVAAAESRTGIRVSLTRVAVLALARRFEDAMRILDALPEPTPHADVAVFRTVKRLLATDYGAAVDYGNDMRKRFPSVSTFDTLLTGAYLLTDQGDEMLAAIDRALVIDPDDDRAWHARGLYYGYVAPDADRSLESYRRAIEINPDSIESWNNLALLYGDLGHFDEAKQAGARAREVGPAESLVLANSGALAQILDRLADADTYFERAAAADPSQPFVYVGRGYQALNRGDAEAAIDEFLAAIAINPVLPGAHNGLAVAYYQAGRFAAAQATIEKAIEIDPDDPIAPQLGSSFNIDQANIGEAIRLAKDALEKSLKFDYFAVESLASARSGITNVGSAYLSLGLNDWANYYAQLAFTPYLANSHFLLSSVYAPRSLRATNGALNLALTLEPTAMSTPNRYFQYVREPGNNLTLGGGYGDEDGAETVSGAATVQGFARIPIPIAYRLDYSDLHNDGFRVNAQSKSKSLNLSAGTRFADRRHHLAANFFATSSNAGQPGPVTAIDPDDRNKSSNLSGALSYHLRLDFDNRILARIGYQSLGTKFRNGRPAGRDTTDTVESLLFNFGEDRTRELLGLGLTDLNVILGCTVTDPCIGVGAFFNPFGPPVPGQLPDILDDDIFATTDSITRTFNAQVRHLFRVGDVDLTWGAELIRQEARTKSMFSNFDFEGIGLLLDPAFVFEPFVQFRTRSETAITESDPDAATVYTQARYKLTDDLWFEAGLFGRYYDDDATKARSQLDPRAGFGWRVLDRHWIRAGYQRELVLPVSSLGPVAPLAVMGFVAPLTEVLNGSSIDNIQAQWDAEWHDRVFTSVRFEEQSIDGWSPLSAPVGVFLFVAEARIRTLDFGVNVWLLERFGLSAKYVLTDAVNESVPGPGDPDLPLIPDSSFSVALNWIHPRQIRASVGAAFVGERYGDIANTVRLDGYWTTNASVNWQPFDRHVSVGVSLINLLDEDFDLATDFPAPGRTVAGSLELRF